MFTIALTIIIKTNSISSDVLCGAHRAEDCRHCIHGFANIFLRNYLWYAWCNEDCLWNPVTKLCNEKGNLNMITSLTIDCIILQIVRKFSTFYYC